MCTRCRRGKTDCLIAFLLSASYTSAIPETLAAECLSNFWQIIKASSFENIGCIDMWMLKRNDTTLSRKFKNIALQLSFLKKTIL